MKDKKSVGALISKFDTTPLDSPEWVLTVEETKNFIGLLEQTVEPSMDHNENSPKLTNNQNNKDDSESSGEKNSEDFKKNLDQILKMELSEKKRGKNRRPSFIENVEKHTIKFVSNIKKGFKSLKVFFSDLLTKVDDIAKMENDTDRKEALRRVSTDAANRAIAEHADKLKGIIKEITSQNAIETSFKELAETMGGIEEACHLLKKILPETDYRNIFLKKKTWHEGAIEQIFNLLSDKRNSFTSKVSYQEFLLDRDYLEFNQLVTCVWTLGDLIEDTATDSEKKTLESVKTQLRESLSLSVVEHFIQYELKGKDTLENAQKSIDHFLKQMAFCINKVGFKGESARKILTDSIRETNFSIIDNEDRNELCLWIDKHFESCLKLKEVSISFHPDTQEVFTKETYFKFT